MKALRSIVILLALTAPAAAAPATDFYLTLLRRGTADVEAGRFAESTTSLRLAAFGLLDSVEHYEIAQAYLAVAFDRLGQTEQARDAAQRIVAAEKVERKFRSIALPASIRTAFDAVAKKVLSAADAAALSGGATAKPNEPLVIDQVDVITESASATPRTQPPAPAQTTRPQQQQNTTQPRTTPAPQNTPPRPQTQPQATQPQATQPQATQPPATQRPQTTQPQSTQRPQTTQPQTTQPQTSTKTRPQTTTPQNGTPRPQTAQPAPVQPRTADPAAQFAAAERALSAANITEARRIYRELLAVQTLDRASLIRLAEGFYRSRDFANALTAFERAGGLRAGEEPYRYYIAVAAYEIGQYDRARRELAAALPYIELTPDVQRYRAKIEAAR